MTRARLHPEPKGINATIVQCPTCEAPVGFACGAAHIDGAHRMRIFAATYAHGERVSIVRHLRLRANEFDEKAKNEARFFEQREPTSVAIATAFATEASAIERGEVAR